MICSEIQARQQKPPDEEARKATEDETSRSTLKDLVAQVHQQQQTLREQEMQMKRNEISFNFKVYSRLFSIFTHSF